MSRRLLLGIAACAAISLTTVTAPSASAIGYWNVPGNFCQCWGYGNGAGYHAPLVLGPISYGGCCHGNVVRLPYPPQPSTGCDYGCGCEASYGDYGQPTVLDAQPTPAAFLPRVSR